jgi:hypothetical protein
MNKGTVAFGISLRDGHSRKSPFSINPHMYLSLTAEKKRFALRKQNKLCSIMW